MSQLVMKRYFVSKEFTRYVNDWLVALGFLLEVALIGEHSTPFLREFRLNDPSIQHPFAVHERVPVWLCLLIITIVPTIVVGGTLLIVHGKNFVGDKEKFKYHLHLLNISYLGLVLTLAINLFLIDLLKNWISRPRPDFIARCGPKITKNLDITKNQDLAICSAPMGLSVLYDGLRSCPSGHSGMAFSSMVYLSLWMMGQLKALVPGVPVWKICVSASPLILAFYIALSRTQDYRHHFGDILLGGGIGTFVAVTIYFKYFHSIFDFEKSHLPYDNNQPQTLQGELLEEEEEEGNTILPF